MKYRYVDGKGEHLHTLDGRPLIGTSTVVKVIAKPLTWWASGMALTPLGWKNGKTTATDERLAHAKEAQARICSLPHEEYAALLQDAYCAHDKTKNTAAKDGTSMHAMLERYVKSCLTDGKLKYAPDAPKPVAVFAAWAMQHVDRFLWSEGNCYSETMWTGGISDCGAKLKDGHTAVIDFKSSKDAYFDQFVQAAGYAQQIGENGLYDEEGNQTSGTIDCDSLIIFPFGSAYPAPKTIFAVEDYQRAFASALTLYKLKEQYETQATH